MKKLIFTLLTTCPPLISLAQQMPMHLWYNKPATFFEESLPIGNGKIGALVYGNPKNDIVRFNDITMWTGKPVDPNEGKGAAQWLPKIREALFQDDYKTADSLQRHLQSYGSAAYQPLATINIIDNNTDEIRNYNRELDLDSALIKITYSQGGVNYIREYFASNPDKLIAIRLKSDKQGALNLQIKMTSLVPHKIKSSKSNQLTITGHATGDPAETIHFCSILTAKTDGRQESNDSTLYIYGGSEATIYFVNETSFNGYDKHPVKEGADYLTKVADDAWHTVNYSYDQFRERHIKDYQKFYDRVKLRLGKELAASKDFCMPSIPTDELLLAHQSNPSTYLETLYFQFGRYLLISSSRTPGVPANLQGLWAHQLWSPWNGNYTMNINIEENYWPAFTTNLAEMAMPLDKFLQALASNGKHTAKNFYGVKEGWCACHNSDIWAKTSPVGRGEESPTWANWNLGGAWLVNTLWEHYLFTQDKDYLRNTVLPLMKGAADFCKAWLIENPKQQGELITAPSTSPEAKYITENGYKGATLYGGTADLAIIRELLINTTHASQVCDQGMTSYESTIKRLHPYTIGKQGDLNEWYYDWDDEEPYHRHQSHLIGLYPGHHLTQTDLQKAARQTLIQKGDNTTGWSTGWRINLWAHLHDGDQAYHIYRKLLTFVHPEEYRGADKRQGGGTYANLFDAHPPFQIDGNFGGTAGVCEMLMQSTLSFHPSPLAKIELLPALPSAWSDGEVKGLCARGGFIVDIAWKNCKVTSATIHATSDGIVEVYYNNKNKTLKLKKGQKKTLR